MTSQTVKQARKCAIWPLSSAKRRHRKAPLRGAQGVLAHGMRHKDGEPKRIMWRIVLDRVRGCRAAEPASCTLQCSCHARSSRSRRSSSRRSNTMKADSSRSSRQQQIFAKVVGQNSLKTAQKRLNFSSRAVTPPAPVSKIGTAVPLYSLLI